MVVRPSTVSEKWESKGSWVLSSSCCRSLTQDHKTSLCQTQGWNKGGSRKNKNKTKNLETIFRPNGDVVTARKTLALTSSSDTPTKRFRVRAELRIQLSARSPPPTHLDATRKYFWMK